MSIDAERRAKGVAPPVARRGRRRSVSAAIATRCGPGICRRPRWDRDRQGRIMRTDIRGRKPLAGLSARLLSAARHGCTHAGDPGEDRCRPAAGEELRAPWWLLLAAAVLTA